MRALFKTGAVALLSAVVVSTGLLAPSVAEPVTHTREEPLVLAAKPVPETTHEAPTPAPDQTPILTATLIPAEEESLLPAVSHDDITVHHQELADAVLRALPFHCRTYLRNFYVQYQNATSRGLGGTSTIILDGSVPDDEFVALLIHECGHVTSGNMKGTSDAGATAFRDGKELFYANSPAAQFFAISWQTTNIRTRGTSTRDYVSGYARSDAFEDFAETFAMYILHRPALRERAKTNTAIAQKLAWMETYLPLPENTFGISQYTWDGTVPWDVTRLEYTSIFAAK